MRMSTNTALSESGRVDDTKGHPQGEIRGPTKLVKITEDVWKCAEEHGISERAALEKGLKRKVCGVCQERRRNLRQNLKVPHLRGQVISSFLCSPSTNSKNNESPAA